MFLRTSRERKRLATSDFVQRLPGLLRFGRFADIDGVTENAQRRIESFVERARDRTVGRELSQIPNQNLLVIPAQANASIFDRLALLGRFHEQVAALRLMRMHDFGKPVVVFRGLDQQLIESTVGQRFGIAVVRFEKNGKQNWCEERAGFVRLERRNSRRILS